MDASCYVIQGLDCPNCAAKVEQAIAKLQETGEVNLDFAASKLYLTLRRDIPKPRRWKPPNAVQKRSNRRW